MPTDAYTVLMDVSNFTSGAQKIAGGLTFLNNKFKDITNATINFDKSGKQVSKTFTGISTEGEKLALTVAKIGKNWGVTNVAMTTFKEKQRLLAADMKKFNADMDRLEKERLAASKANAQQAANIGALGRNLTAAQSAKAAGGILAPSLSTMGVGTAPGTATAGELFNQAKAVGSVQAFAAANRISAATVNRVWTDVGNNVFKPYNGRLGELQTKLFNVRNATLAVGTANAVAAKESKGFLLSWESVARFFEARLLYNAIGSITGAIKDSITQATEFQLVLGRIRTLAPELSGSTDAWGDSVKRISTVYAVDATDAAKSYYSALSNQIGNSIAEIESFTATTAEFARTTGATAEQSNNLFSSAINAFKLNVTDTKDLAAKFFKTIDLGRITAAGLSDTFGRVAVAAHTVGFSLNETLAALTVLTRQGVSESDAMTQVLNITNKLLKPTDAMKVKLQEWGYASGQALVENEGFLGVLKRLDAELAKGGAGELAKELGDIRAVRGGFGLTGEGLKEFARDLSQIGTAQKQYTRAVEVTAETVGFKWAKQLNEVKVMFLSLGEDALKVLTNITGAFGGLTNIIKAVTAATITLGFAYGGIMLRNTLAFASATIVSFASIGRALAALRVALFTTFGPAGWIALAVGAVVSWALLSENSADRAKRAFAEAGEAMKDSIGRAVEQVGLQYDQLAETARNSFKPFFTEASRIRSVINAQLKGIDTDLDKMKDGFSDFAKLTMQSVEDVVSVIRENISGLKSDIKSIDESISKAFRKEQLADFRDTIDELSSGQQAKKIASKIGELYTSAKQLSIKSAQALAGGDEQTAKELFDQSREQAKLAESLQTDLSNAAKASIKDQAKAKKAVLEDSKRDTDDTRERIALQQELNTLSVNHALKKNASAADISTANKKLELDEMRKEEIRKRLAALDAKAIEDSKTLTTTTKDLVNPEQLLEAAARQMADALTLQRDLAQDMLKIENTRLSAIEKQKVVLDTSLQSMSKLITDSDKMKPEEIISMVDKSIADYRKSMSEIAKIASKEGTVFVPDTAGFASLLEIASKLREKAKLTATRDTGEELRVEMQRRAEETEKRITAEKGKQQKFQEQRGTSIQNFVASIEQLGTVSSGALLGGTAKDRQDTADTYNTTVEKLKEIAELLKQSPNLVEAYRTQIQELVTTMTTLDSGKAGVQFSNVNKNIGDLFSKTGTEKITDILDFAKAANDLVTLQQNINSTSTTLADLTTQNNTLRAAYTAASQAGVDGMNAVTRAAELQRMTIQQLIDAQRALAVPNAPTDAKNGGGMAHFAGGGRPYGSDKIPSLLSPGEFVVNAGASRKFYSQLVAMNSGSRNYAGGGSVNTNVGDINISMASGGNASTDVVRIGKLLKREIRRGTVSLH